MRQEMTDATVQEILASIRLHAGEYLGDCFAESKTPEDVVHHMLWANEHQSLAVILDEGEYVAFDIACGDWIYQNQAVFDSLEEAIQACEQYLAMVMAAADQVP